MAKAKSKAVLIWRGWEARFERSKMQSELKTEQLGAASKGPRARRGNSRQAALLTCCGQRTILEGAHGQMEKQG